MIGYDVPDNQKFPLDLNLDEIVTQVHKISPLRGIYFEDNCECVLILSKYTKSSLSQHTKMLNQHFEDHKNLYGKDKGYVIGFLS